MLGDRTSLGGAKVPIENKGLDIEFRSAQEHFVELSTAEHEARVHRVADLRDLVDDLVLGRDDDLERALQTGRLAVMGNVKALSALGMTFGEAQSALSTQLQARGPQASSKAPKSSGSKNSGPKSKR